MKHWLSAETELNRGLHVLLGQLSAANGQYVGQCVGYRRLQRPLRPPPCLVAVGVLSESRDLQQDFMATSYDILQMVTYLDSSRTHTFFTLMVIPAVIITHVHTAVLHTYTKATSVYVHNHHVHTERTVQHS